LELPVRAHPGESDYPVPGTDERLPVNQPREDELRSQAIRPGALMLLQEESLAIIFQ
jgi:hypothetical protein